MRAVPGGPHGTDRNAKHEKHRSLLERGIALCLAADTQLTKAVNLGQSAARIFDALMIVSIKTPIGIARQECGRSGPRNGFIIA